VGYSHFSFIIFWPARQAMKDPSMFKTLATGALLGAAAATAFAHVSLPPGPAVAGSVYEATFSVGHPCEGAASTTALAVRLPHGFTLQDVPAHPGWKTDIDRSGDGSVRWTADSAAQALPAAQPGHFTLRGKLPAHAGPLYFEARQTCDTGSADWAQQPTGAADEKLPFPAPHLLVVAPGSAPVEARGAWVRMSVPGQSGTGGFVKLAAGVPLKATPVAGESAVHEMKLDGDTMKMRPIAALDLPAHQFVELKPGGYHLMLTDLKQALAVGQQVPLTLTFEDAQGVKSTLSLQAPVLAAPPAGSTGGAGMDHAHMP
jgi:copper(I)-binding protein